MHNVARSARFVNGRKQVNCRRYVNVYSVYHRPTRVQHNVREL